MDSKTVKELAEAAAMERSAPAIKSNLDGIYEVLRNEAKNGFQTAFYRERVPSFALPAIKKELVSKGFVVKEVALPESDNYVYLKIYGNG